VKRFVEAVRGLFDLFGPRIVITFSLVFAVGTRQGFATSVRDGVGFVIAGVVIYGSAFAFVWPREDPPWRAARRAVRRK
jgi:hypothetical protein